MKKREDLHREEKQRGFKKDRKNWGTQSTNNGPERLALTVKERRQVSQNEGEFCKELHDRRIEKPSRGGKGKESFHYRGRAAANATHIKKRRRTNAVLAGGKDAGKRTRWVKLQKQFG